MFSHPPGILPYTCDLVKQANCANSSHLFTRLWPKALKRWHSWSLVDWQCDLTWKVTEDVICCWSVGEGSKVSYLRGNTLKTKSPAKLLRLPAALSSLGRLNISNLMFKPLNDKLQHNIISIGTFIHSSPEASSLSKRSIWPNVSLTTISSIFYPKTHLDNFSLCFSPYEIREYRISCIPI